MTRKFVIRHLTRDKANQADPQTPTLMGEVEALTMGILLRREYDVLRFHEVISSPQPRAVRTAELILSGVAGWETHRTRPEVETDAGLEDFSSDPRFFPLKADLKKAKGCAEIESEQAIFLAGGALAELRQTKLDEAIRVIDDTEETGGDVLIGGLHGATIDGLYAHYAKILDSQTKDGMSAFGRQIGKCEGFILIYDDHGKLSTIQKIERPSWLNAVAALIGGGGD